jgi:hypothetical protein
LPSAAAARAAYQVAVLNALARVQRESNAPRAKRKTAPLTGSTSGIGLGMTRFAEQGSKLAPQ